MNIKYRELLSFSIEQEFYANGLYKRSDTAPVLDFQIVPTQECSEICRRLDLIVRANDFKAGMSVYGRVLGQNGGGDDLLRFPPRADDKLTFWLALNNPDVINFNILPIVRNAGEVYYFTNQITDGAALRSRLHLSSASSGVDANLDAIHKATADYRYHHSAEITPGTVKVKHLLSGATLAPQSLVNQSGQCDLAFDLTSLPLGKCQLLISNVKTDEFYYIGSQMMPSLFGVIELSLANTLAANYRIVEPDRSLLAQRPKFVIQFRKRKTRWRYTIHLLPASPLYLEMQGLSAPDKADFLSRFNIITNDTGVTFSQVSAGDTDFVFESDNDLALQENYISSSSATPNPLSMTLKKYIGNVSKEAAVRSGLSYPSTNLIDATTAPFIYSDVFITL